MDNLIYCGTCGARTRVPGGFCPKCEQPAIDAALTEQFDDDLNRFVARWRGLRRGADLGGALVAAFVEVAIDAKACEPNVRSVMRLARELVLTSLAARTLRERAGV